ncbi:MAG: phenylalanine--tRNA ligase subunit beta [Candidatus Omnitrophota bacterium]
MRVLFSWLKDYVDIRISPEELAGKLTMAGLEVTSLSRVDQDALMEIEVTPNRTDCLSIIGIAREVAAITDKQLKLPTIAALRGLAHQAIPIQIDDKKHCGRYLGRVIKHLQVGPSPQWLVQRLELIGVRPVNNIVDVTNYCLWEWGQPLHAFDLDKLSGQRLVVRRAAKDETIITIDAVKRELKPEMLVIADKTKAQAIAGIMGAKESEVSETTTNIVLESAYFDPLNIHRTSQALGLATQSSYRFERGVDIACVEIASLRAVEMIKELAAPKAKKKARAMLVGKLIDKGMARARSTRVKLRIAKFAECLGMAVTAAQIKESLQRLGLTVVRKTAAGMIVEVPPFRPDVTREVDLIEEVARMLGYEQTPLSLAQLAPNLSSAGQLELAHEKAYSEIRHLLAALELNEIMTYSLISRQTLKKLESAFETVATVKNPLSYEQEILRPTLLVGMLASILTNLNRKNTHLRLFELSRVYTKEGTHPIREQTHLCIGLSGKTGESWLEKSREHTFFDLKGIIEALLVRLGVKEWRFVPRRLPNFVPGRSAELVVAEESLGVMGEITRSVADKFDIGLPVFAAELAAYKLLPYLEQKKQFAPLARFPAIERDISLIAPNELRCEEILALISKMGRGLVEKVTLFDQYVGEQISHGFRGLAYSIQYRSKEKTLTAEEVDLLQTQIRQALVEQLKVQIR